MTPRLRVVLIVVGLVASLLPKAAPASDGWGCGGGWRTTPPQTECRVRLTGLPITVSGSAIGPNARVHVRLYAPTSPPLLILECSATDADPGPVDHVASCEAPLVDQPDLLMPLPEITVRCSVQGVTSPAPALPGDYYCQTGTVGLPGT